MHEALSTQSNDWHCQGTVENHLPQGQVLTCAGWYFSINLGHRAGSCLCPANQAVGARASPGGSGRSATARAVLPAAGSNRSSRARGGAQQALAPGITADGQRASPASEVSSARTHRVMSDLYFFCSSFSWDTPGNKPQSDTA